MILLGRYIGRRVVAGTVWTLLVLITLLGFFFFIEELGDVGEGRYRTADAALYVLLILPRYAYEIFPVAALIGSLIGLGSLANHSELTAMRAGGMSLARIVSAVRPVPFARAPFARRNAEVLPERPCECRRVVEPAVERDGEHGVLGPDYEQLRRPFEAQSSDVAE